MSAPLVDAAKLMFIMATIELGLMIPVCLFARMMEKRDEKLKHGRGL